MARTAQRHADECLSRPGLTLIGEADIALSLKLAYEAMTPEDKATLTKWTRRVSAHMGRGIGHLSCLWLLVMLDEECAVKLDRMDEHLGASGEWPIST